MAKKDSGKTQAEKDTAELAQGQVENAQGQWVDPGNLSPKQQLEVQTESNTPPKSALPKSVQAGETANEPGAGTPPESSWEKLADTQAQQYLNMVNAAQPLTSGQSLPAIEATASQQAEQMLGQSSTSPVSQWLNAQTQAAQGQNAPVAAAMAQTGQAETSAANLEASGLQNMGTAEAKMMQAAPYQQLLNTLAADVPYKLLGGTPFSSLTTEVGQAVSSIPGLSTTAVPSANAASAPNINTGIVPPPPTTPTTAPGVTG